jgi:anaerobic selenocysteine-containing dehydrogenase
MKTNLTRRDILRFAAGAAAGVVLSPAPWRLTDDLAIWTQNWSWIPVPPRGEPTLRMTVCSLCPAGCAVQARCIGGRPVSLHAVAADAVSGGALCPLGLTGHHLAYHPARLSAPVRIVGKDGARRALPVQIDALVTETARAIAKTTASGGTVAVLDMRPSRSISWAWRRLLASLPGGVVIPAPGRAGASLATLRTMVPGQGGEFGLDLEGVRTVLSFGAPLAEGWGTPGRAARVVGRGSARAHLVQVEPVRSATAERADRWLPVRPGTEALLALGLGHVLVAEGLVGPQAAGRVRDLAEYAALVARVTPETVATATGVPAEAIAATARELARQAPALVVAGEDDGGGRLGRVAETAVWGLGLLLGGGTRPGGLVQRAELPAPDRDGPLAPVRELNEVADRSVAVLVVDASAGDGAFPWALVERKLVPEGALVVVLSPFLAGTAKRADLVVPTAPFLEGVEELPTSFDSPLATFAVATPLVQPRPGVVDPVAFIRAVARACGADCPGTWGTSEALVIARAAQIHRSGRGALVAFADGAVTRTAAVSSPEAFWAALKSGARWQDEPLAPTPETQFSLLGGGAAELARVAANAGTTMRADARRPLTLLPRGRRDVTASAAVSPVLTKLYRESGLRRSPGTAVVSPETAGRLGLRAGRRAVLETAAGKIPVAIALDAGVMPGVVEVSVGPDASALGDRCLFGAAGVLDICGGGDGEAWGRNAARLAEA